MKGLLDFNVSSPARNERSWGAASFEYNLQFSNQGRFPIIIMEAGDTKQRNKGPLSSSPSIPGPSVQPPASQGFPNQTQAVVAPQRPCDELAANPTDTRRVASVTGVSFNALKSQADRAIAACESATAEFPSELRFQYQLARALERKDRTRAFALHGKLARLQYPASFDNLGWLYIEDQNNPQLAVQSFIAGVKLGDPNSMISLAEMIDRGNYSVQNPSETKVVLFKRAAELGHPNAAKALNAEMGKLQQHASDEETQRQMLELFGSILRNVPRR